MLIKTKLQQSMKISFKQKSLINIKYQLILFEIKSIIERLLLHVINNFKDLVKKKKRLYVIKFYIFKSETDLFM